MGNAGVKRAGAQFAGILQRLLGRQRQEINDPDHRKGDGQGEPVDSAEQRRHSHGQPAALGGGRWFRGLTFGVLRFLLFHFRRYSFGFGERRKTNSRSGTQCGLSIQKWRAKYSVRFATTRRAGRRRRFDCSASWRPRDRDGARRPGMLIFLSESRQGQQHANGRGSKPVQHPEHVRPDVRRGKKAPFNSRRGTARFPGTQLVLQPVHLFHTLSFPNTV